MGKHNINTPDTSSMDYKYGIWARMANGGSGSRDWTDEQIKFWMDKNDIEYEDTDTRENLVERIKQAGYK